jgi:hypothetical protein
MLFAARPTIRRLRLRASPKKTVATARIGNQTLKDAFNAMRLRAFEHTLALNALDARAIHLSCVKRGSSSRRRIKT